MRRPARHAEMDDTFRLGRKVEAALLVEVGEVSGRAGGCIGELGECYTAEPGEGFPEESATGEVVGEGLLECVLVLKFFHGFMPDGVMFLRA